MADSGNRFPIFRKLMFLYFGTIIILFGIFASGLSIFYTSYYIHSQQEQLILQGERFNGTINSMYRTGIVDSSRVGFEFEAMEKYMNTSVFFVNSNGMISVVSSDIDPKWIGQSLSDEATEAVFQGKVVTTEGKIEGMFDEIVMTVGYPISINGQIIGGIFMCKPMSVLNNAVHDVYQLIVIYIIPLVLAGAVVVYFMSRRITRPLVEMNRAAKFIAGGNFDKRIENVDSNDEVSELAESFNFMAESLEQTEKKRMEFIGNISHDLRSPLTSIRGFIEAIYDGTIPPEKHRHYLKIVIEETQRLSKLANDMMDLNAAESGATVLDRSDFDINDIIRESLDSMEPRFVDKEIFADAVFAEEKTMVNADPNKIKRVLQNLIDNAIKFSEQEGSITVETKINGNKAEIYVKDTGKGITDEEIKRVFDRFFKADTSRGIDKSGVGLGLSIVREFIKAHGETVEVHKREEKGTEFMFTLPLSETDK